MGRRESGPSRRHVAAPRIGTSSLQPPASRLQTPASRPQTPDCRQPRSPASSPILRPMSQPYHAPPRASFLQKLGPGGVASLGLAILTVLGGAGLPWVFRCWQVLRGVHGDEPVSADAILVLGRCLDGDRLTPVFEARLAHAEVLWRRGFAPRIFVAGGTTGTAVRS